MSSPVFKTSNSNDRNPLYLEFNAQTKITAVACDGKQGWYASRLVFYDEKGSQIN